MTDSTDDEEAYAVEDASTRAQGFLYRAMFRFMDEECGEDEAQTRVALVLACLKNAAVVAQTTGGYELGTKAGFLHLAGEIYDEEQVED